nr:hypothetical protein [Tanacetum cinerariifolium]
MKERASWDWDNNTWGGWGKGLGTVPVDAGVLGVAPYFKIIRADGNHMLFMSFSTMMKNFNREDLESLWKILNVEANVWKDQKGKYGLAKVKSWKLIESCGVHCLTLSTTLIFLLVEKMYHLTHFILEQMVNDVRIEVDDESEMSLELLRLVKRQLNEGYVHQ